MAEPDVALVFTSELWVESLHRHLSDHGGARVRQLVLDPQLALDESFDVLVVSYRWPALTVGFVEAMHERGRRVLGVFDDGEAPSRDLLAHLGVDGAVACDASMQEFVAAINGVSTQPVDPPEVSMAGFGSGPGLSGPARSALSIVVSGGAGTGVTEVSVALAHHFGMIQTSPTLLIDANESTPGVGPRLGLSLEPNLRTAIEVVEHGLRSRSGFVHSHASGTLDAIVGVPNHGGARIRVGEMSRVLAAGARSHGVVVVDAGVLGRAPAGGVAGSAYRSDADDTNRVVRTLIAEADVIVGVADASPLGVTRLIGWAAECRFLAPAVPLFIVFNRAPNERFRREEITRELGTVGALAGIVFLPHDRRVGAAAWSGDLVRRGRFASGVRRLAAAVDSGAVHDDHSVLQAGRRRGRRRAPIGAALAGSDRC